MEDCDLLTLDEMSSLAPTKELTIFNRAGYFVNCFGDAFMFCYKNNRLDDATVNEIKTKHLTGNYSVNSLAIEYKVDRTTIDRIVENPLGKNYKRLKLSLSHYGYYQISLYQNSKQKLKKIHTLVLTLFDRPRKRGEVCRHLDGNKLNNRIENLKWGTWAENEADKILHGTHNRGERNGQAKLTVPIVLEIRQLWKSGGFTQSQIGYMFKIARSHVGAIVLKKLWKHC